MAQGFSKGKSVIGGAGVKCFVNGSVTATTSGSNIDFTIPSGVKKITLAGRAISTSASVNPIIQIGDSTGVKTSGYTCTAGYIVNAGATSIVTSGSGWYVPLASSSSDLTFSLELTLIDAATNHWVGVLTGNWYTAGNYIAFSSGEGALSNELTTVRLGVSSGTFDAGTLNVQYDNPEPVILKDSGRGIAVQTVNTTEVELVSTTGTIPADNTIPQNTEGGEVMTASITPQNASNLLKIEVVCQVSNNTTSREIAVALFQDSTANALASTPGTWHAVSGEFSTVSLIHWMTAGTASSTTFKVRIGGNAAGTVYINGNSAGRRAGGVCSSSITITEYKV